MAIDGFLTRSVRDTAALLDATQGPDLGAPYVAPALPESFIQAIARPPVRLRVAVSTVSFTGGTIHPECRAAVEHAAGLLSRLGHEVIDAPIHPAGSPIPVDIRQLMQAWTDIIACGTALSVREGEHASGRSATDDDLEMITRAAVRHAATVSGADYLAAVDIVHASGRSMAGAMQDVDVLVTATLAEPPARIGRFAPTLEGFDHDDFVQYRLGAGGVLAYSPFTPLANATGQPAMSVPLYWSRPTATTASLPIGVHVMGRFGDDTLLMQLAAQLEEAQPWWNRRPPCHTSTI